MEVFCRIRLILYVKNIGSLCSNLSEATDLAFAAFAPPSQGGLLRITRAGVPRDLESRI